MIPIRLSTMIVFTTRSLVAAYEKNGMANRRKPYVPIFRSTPARITEPAVGASTCASGSQVWNGNSGTLIANASAKAENSQNWSERGTGSCTRSLYANVTTPNCL